jgi:RNA polymerase sigma factor (TIGR02999 family)
MNEVIKMEDLTQLLQAWQNGDPEAVHKLIPLVYRELHRIAGRYMRRHKADYAVQTTALVHEAYCKLIDQKKVHWQNRAHFFAIASKLMRRILVDRARRQAASKRGGAIATITLNESIIATAGRAEEFMALDEALTALAEIDPRKSRIVEMKFFGGLSTEEMAEVEKVSITTIEREWRKARAWLYHEMRAR